MQNYKIASLSMKQKEVLTTYPNKKQITTYEVNTIINITWQALPIKFNLQKFLYNSCNIFPEQIEKEESFD